MYGIKGRSSKSGDLMEHLNEVTRARNEFRRSKMAFWMPFYSSDLQVTKGLTRGHLKEV